MSMEMMLQTKDLCKSFKKQKAVNKVSLNIEKWKVYGLLGPNGAGKSTTLKMITGVLKPTAGEIYFDGKPWSRESLSGIGALIENPPVYENLSARENLKVRSLLLGVDEKRIDAIKTVGDKLSKYIEINDSKKTLSSLENASSYNNFRNVLRKILKSKIKDDNELLFTFDDYVVNLFPEGNLTWRETQDLLLFRIYENLHDWMVENDFVEEVSEEELLEE